MGLDIFVSFAWLDIRFVSKIAKVLYKHRRRYYMFVEPNQGLGNTPSRNSTEAVKQAGAVLIIASSNYVARYRDAPDGYIAKEIFEMSKRVGGENLPVVILSVDDYKEIRGKLPWSQLGLDETPFTGKPIRYASDIEVERAVNEILGVIDRK